MLVLLDRDGVLNEDLPDSVRSPEQLKLLPGAGKGVAMLNKAGMKVVVVSNQSIIGRGIINSETLLLIHARLLRELAGYGAILDDIFICPDTVDKPSYRRKPKPGMLLDAIKKYDALPENTPMVGDDMRDMEAAAAAGCPRYLVRTGKGNIMVAKGIQPSLMPVEICDDLFDAAQRILKRFG